MVKVRKKTVELSFWIRTYLPQRQIKMMYAVHKFYTFFILEGVKHNKHMIFFIAKLYIVLLITYTI